MSFQIDIKVSIPEWVHVLPNNNEIKQHYMEKIRESVVSVEKSKMWITSWNTSKLRIY